jgi:hypothetical protein
MELDFQVVPWSEVEEYAIPMFDLHHSERGLAWAKQAWAFLEAKDLTAAEGLFAEGLTYLRLVALAMIHDEYSTVAWNKSKGLSAVQWAADMPLSTFALGRMCGFDRLFITGRTEADMCAETITHVADTSRWEVGCALVAGYGSVDGLHASLWHIRHDPQDPTTPNAFSNEGPQKRAMAYLEEMIIPNTKQKEW